MAQAKAVAAALEKAHGWPTGSVEIRAIRTSGDRIQDRPIAEVGGKALWTKELDLMLSAEETDFSVHSMKDVESERPAEFTIAAMLPRADVRDRLIGASAIEALPHGATVGTSSPRRKAQLLHCRPDLHIMPIRGNVQTRLDKIERGDADATLLAAAGLDRLDMAEGSPIPLDVILPAPGQAAIGVECRTADERIRALLDAINDAPTCRCVAAERAFSRRLGATCHSPVAALAELTGDRLRFRADLFSPDGTERVTEESVIDLPEEAAAIADTMLASAPPSIRAVFGGVS
ncbi:hydroxymethylbilane synthase [Sphingomonas sp. HDW15A]|uniref:hydroxymethylbilane synthase n=1 Tax=Sphingomonas sp. HDW15A TaxID=2714942 RepID=UPI001F0E86FF|nr:hydroxymethylbilane synthase [Sphingomonas sp. HDW15A]